MESDVGTASASAHPAYFGLSSDHDGSERNGLDVDRNWNSQGGDEDVSRDDDGEIDICAEYGKCDHLYVFEDELKIDTGPGELKYEQVYPGKGLPYYRYAPIES